MKLIDLLVQELPKRGGWPDGAEYARVSGFGGEKILVEFLFPERYNKLSYSIGIIACHLIDAGVDCQMIRRHSYEAALAALQKPAWNGEGLPPVGEKVEFFINPKFGYRNAWIPDVGTEMEVVAHKTTTDGNDVAVCYWDEGGAGRSCCFVPESLKPARTESERKHEAVLESICAVLEMVAQDYKRSDEAKLIYEAIAAGKIPGVKLDG